MVLFPLPLLPTIPTKAPAGTLKLTFFTTWGEPSANGNRYPEISPHQPQGAKEVDLIHSQIPQQLHLQRH